MKKYLSVVALLMLFSCGKEEKVLLPQCDMTIVKEMSDWTPVYIFFRTNGKDTLAEVNRKNTISTTNWIFDIDRRLPLRLVIPEIVKLQAKRKSAMHENPNAGNYFSYADTIGKNLAFLPFTNVNFHLQKPVSKPILKVYKDGQFEFDYQKINKGELKNKINNFTAVNLVFDKNCSYGIYVQQKVFLESLKLKITGEYID